MTIEHRIIENASGATCSCGKSWTCWGDAYDGRTTDQRARTVPLLRATARRHAAAGNRP